MLRLALAIAFAIGVLAACGGGGDDDTATPGSSFVATTAPASDGDPAALANEMIDHYVEMTDALVALLDQDLSPAELAPEIAALKTEYIDIFVAIGHQREAMSDEDVSAFNSRAAGIFSLPFDHQDSLSDLLSELNATGENELANEINSLNILTQYAQFELLWDQEPDEAQRLALPSPAHPR